MRKQILSEEEIYLNAEALEYFGVSPAKKRAGYKQIVHSISEGNGGNTREGLDKLTEVMTDMLASYASD